MCIPVSPGVDEKPQVRSALSSGPFRVLGTNAAPILDFPVANASVRSHSKKALIRESREWLPEWLPAAFRQPV